MSSSNFSGLFKSALPHKRGGSNGWFHTGLGLKIFPYWLFRWHARLMRGKTLGARVVVVDEQERVLLVRPGYVAGWTLPGGGVDRGETLAQAAVRELMEDAAVEALEPLQFHGIFSNDADFPGDHVACYVLRRFTQGAFKPGFEIREARFFHLHELPPDLKPGSRARIDEVLRGATISEHWKP
jgi:ADP-ribose pyrophosphatase YjhB (NUDIX family)